MLLIARFGLAKAPVWLVSVVPVVTLVPCSLLTLPLVLECVKEASSCQPRDSRFLKMTWKPL